MVIDWILNLYAKFYDLLDLFDLSDPLDLLEQMSHISIGFNFFLYKQLSSFFWIWKLPFLKINKF